MPHCKHGRWHAYLECLQCAFDLECRRIRMGTYVIFDTGR